MWQTNIFNQMYLIHDCLFLGIRILLSLHKLVIFQQSGKHPSKEMAKLCDADKSGESSDSSSDSEFNKNSNGIDTTASNQNCGTIESSQTPENMESISESEKQKLNQEGCNDESELMKLRKQNMDEQELFFAANGLPVCIFALELYALWGQGPETDPYPYPCNSIVLICK